MMTRRFRRIGAGVRLETLVGRWVAAALGVFGRFQIANFYVFLGCCHNVSFAVSGYWFVLCKTHRTTSDARQRHFP